MNAMNRQQPTLGQLLRGLRQRNDWTLKEMSVRSGIPVSTLSKVEHDRLTLTYDKLVQLSQRLRIRMSELFAEEVEEAVPTVMTRRSIGQLERAVQITTSRYDYSYLCTDLRRKRMIPFVMNVKTKSLDEFGEFSRHSGEEYDFVLKGRIEVHTEFYDTVTLEEGESIYIDSTMGHALIVAPGCDEAFVLGVCSSAEDDIMESLMHLHRGDEGAALTPTAQRFGSAAPDKAAARVFRAAGRS